MSHVFHVAFFAKKIYIALPVAVVQNRFCKLLGHFHIPAPTMPVRCATHANVVKAFLCSVLKLRGVSHGCGVEWRQHWDLLRKTANGTSESECERLRKSRNNGALKSSGKAFIAFAACFSRKLEPIDLLLGSLRTSVHFLIHLANG